MMTINLLLAAAVTCLTTEYQTNPIGLDVTRPRLSWKLPVEIHQQSAYEIEAAGWHSGKVASNQSVNIPWGGVALQTGERVSWRVRVWDADDEPSDWSEPASFTMGVMQPADWLAKWIGPDPSTQPDEDMSGCEWLTANRDTNDCVHLTHTFEFVPGPGKVLELVCTANPQHFMWLNGRRVAPYHGHVHRWKYLRTLDLAPYCTNGVNTLTIDVVGWREHDDGNRAFWGKLTFPDGRVVRSTCANWTSSQGGVRSLGEKPAFATDLKLRMETVAPAFEKSFEVKPGLARATLYITGVGYYEAQLNGSKIGKKVLDPSPTEFDHHILYSTYLLDHDLKPGLNTLKVLVGHGWYDIRTLESWDFLSCNWRDFPRMIAQLELEYADGTKETIVSDATWRQVASPVRYDCIREGEIVGPELALPADLKAVVVPGPKGMLVAENMPGSVVARTLKPIAVRETSPGAWEVKFAENIAGWVRLTIEGQDTGDVVVVTYDERSQQEIDGDPRGRYIDWHFRHSSSQRFCAIGQGFQKDRIICRGGEERYEPRFTYNGFQYVHLTGLKKAPKSIVACVVRTDFPIIGSFESSDRTLNALCRAAEHSYCANFANGFPTDCPHREKNGWTGDASIASELAQYYCENTPAYAKYVQNICDTQLPSGDISCIAPSGGWGYWWGNGPGWDAALYIIAWNMYCYRDDRRILDMIYPALVRYLDFTATKADANGLVKHGLGDWIPVVAGHMPAFEYTSSCYYLQAQAIAAKIAYLKNDFVAAMTHEAGARKTRAGIRAKYLKPGCIWDDGGQTAQACALAFGLVEPNEKAATFENLVKSVEKTDYHMDMGLFGSKWVFRELARNGRADLAIRMLTNPTAPSMVEWLQKHDGQTLWEDWGVGQSRNHIMFGDFYAVAYQYLAGLRLPERDGSLSAMPQFTELGFREVVIEPCVIESLASVSASVDTPYGVYQSSWERRDGKLSYFFEIPSGGRAVLRLPGHDDETVGPGRYIR